jgi:hypothetical protein
MQISSLSRYRRRTSLSTRSVNSSSPAHGSVRRPDKVSIRGSLTIETTPLGQGRISDAYEQGYLRATSQIRASLAPWNSKEYNARKYSASPIVAVCELIRGPWECWEKPVNSKSGDLWKQRKQRGKEPKLIAESSIRRRSI